ncbi:MAG: hypothetical protein F6J97_18980 [Leptolyngbya sp. SIO4C1]|nr:hypothetical protein [Leptolyngbya sp. SIO4C1]
MDAISADTSNPAERPVKPLMETLEVAAARASDAESGSAGLLVKALAYISEQPFTPDTDQTETQN